MDESRQFQQVMVIGAGVMGAAIATHAASCGCSVFLLDMLPFGGLTPEDRDQGLNEESPKWRNRLAANGLNRALNHRPPLFYDVADAARIEVGNVEDDLHKAGHCDWIIEAIPENPAWKQALYARIEPYLQPGAAVSSNTSGIQLETLLKGRSERFRSQFLITHFFNPVRYMKLLEIIPSQYTDRVLAEDLTAFCRTRMGKGIVLAKNTPGFVANRIGVHAMNTAAIHAVKAGIRPETADLLSGSLMGRANSGTFRTMDLVGIDTLVMVDDNLCETCPADERRDELKAPAILRSLAGQGLFGNKSGAGFYKVEKTPAGKQFLSIDYASLAYGPQEKPTFASLDAAAAVKDPGAKLRAVMEAGDVAASYVWNTVRDNLWYSASRVPEIADRVKSVDDGMKWGYNWAMGPFELWDALGVAWVADRLKAEGVSLPPLVTAVLEKGQGSFYLKKDGLVLEFDPVSHTYREVAGSPEAIAISRLKATGRVVESRPDASLLDLGDDVWLLEFTTKMNTITQGVIDMAMTAVDRAVTEGKALVIGNEGRVFCAGANLAEVLALAEAGDFDGIDAFVARFQQLVTRIKFAPVPVVAASFGLTLGGGLELAFAADAVVAHVEGRMGLVEVGAGVIPGGGGIKELYLNLERVSQVEGPVPLAKAVFETVMGAVTAENAKQARNLGFLSKDDRIVFDGDSLLPEAKKLALSLKELGYTPPAPRRFSLPGPGVAETFVAAMEDARAMGRATDYDLSMARVVARVVTGGETSMAREISEQDWLDLERAAFVELCRQQGTKDRMVHILKTGKPLRN